MQTQRLALGLGCIGLSGFLLAGCTLPGMAKKETSSPEANPVATNEPQSAVDQMANTAKLTAMMATGQAGTCTITNTTNPGEGQMTIKMKGKKFLFSGNTMVTEDDGQSKPGTIGYMLNDTEYMYIWEDQGTSGFKIKATQENGKTPEVSMPEEATGEMSGQSESPLAKYENDESYAINCALGEVSDAELTPPSTIQFVDMNQAMPKGASGGSMPPQL